jgi:anaerobic ribonucleoside-triphosphate reductase
MSYSENPIRTESILQNKNPNRREIPVEVYSRVVGYYRPVNQWNKGKQEEFEERKEYSIESIERSLAVEIS